MQYTGNFLFDKKIHAVTCSISDDNNIYTIVHETDINGYKRKISGWAGNNYITIYGSRMVDYGKDYYKYQSQYATICSIKLNLTKSDLINNIYDFKFCFSPLNEWLETNTIFLENNKIKLLMPDDIILMNNSDVSIKIKYFKNGIEGISEATTLKNIEITPYIVVKSTKKISIKGVMNYIQMITRFFATLIGYTGNVKEIYFHNYINGKLKFDFIENSIME